MINEDLVEQAALAILQEQGMPYLGADVISPDGKQPERVSYGEVLLMGRLEEAVARLNPNIPEDARRDALRQITGAASQSLTEETGEFTRCWSMAWMWSSRQMTERSGVTRSGLSISTTRRPTIGW